MVTNWRRGNALHRGGGQWLHDAPGLQMNTGRNKIKHNMPPLSELMSVDETFAAVSKPPLSEAMSTGKPQAAANR